MRLFDNSDEFERVYARLRDMDERIDRLGGGAALARLQGFANKLEARIDEQAVEIERLRSEVAALRRGDPPKKKATIKLAGGQELNFCQGPPTLDELSKAVDVLRGLNAPPAGETATVPNEIVPDRPDARPVPLGGQHYISEYEDGTKYGPR